MSSRRLKSDRFRELVEQIKMLAEELAKLPEVPGFHRYQITQIKGDGVTVNIFRNVFGEKPAKGAG